MSLNVSRISPSLPSLHVGANIQRTCYILIETVAASVVRTASLSGHCAAFDKLLESLQRQGQQYPDAYKHPHITSSTICDLGEARILIRRWFRDDILVKAEISEKLKRMIQIAKALVHLHQHHIVHGHLHPGNIFITAEGDATVVDVSLNLFARHHTSEGSRIGLDSSSVYQAPEALDFRQTRLEPPSDVYAFGSIIYAVMTGNSPLDAGSMQLIKASRDEICLFGHSRIPQPPATVMADELWQVIGRCWSYNPLSRPTMKDVVFDLEDIYLYV